MKLLRGLLLLLLIGSALGIGYHPVQDGFSWTYDNGETQQLSGPQDFDGRQVMALTRLLRGELVSQDYLAYSADGVHLIATVAGSNVIRYEPPLLTYGPPPLQVDGSWQSTARLPGYEVTMASEVLAVRGVSTEAGRFNAYQIRQVTVTSTGAQTILHLYFVPGVGIVRFVTQDGDIVDLVERNF